MALPDVRVGQTTHGGGLFAREYSVPSSPSAAWLAGQLVALTGTDDEVDGAGNDPSELLGIAREGSSGNEGTKIVVDVITPGTVISIAKISGDFADDDVGDPGNLSYASSTWTFEPNTGTNQIARCIGKDETDDDNRLLVTVEEAALQITGPGTETN